MGERTRDRAAMVGGALALCCGLMTVALLAELVGGTPWISTACFLGFTLVVVVVLVSTDGRAIQIGRANAPALFWITVAVAVAATIAARL